MRPAVLSAARCRSPMYPKAGSATAAPGSSSLRPTTRSARSPHRHRPSRSADAGNCIRRAATGYDGKSRSSRARHCAEGAAGCWPSPRRAVNATMNVSWAACRNRVRRFARFPCREPLPLIFMPHSHKYQCLGWRCSKGSMDPNLSHSYPFHNAGVTESSGVELASSGVELAPSPLP